MRTRISGFNENSLRNLNYAFGKEFGCYFSYVRSDSLTIGVNANSGAYRSITLTPGQKARIMERFPQAVITDED